MSACQVIIETVKPGKMKDISTIRPCGNYARKGMTCCWSHRKLENDVPEPEPEKEPKKKRINGARQIALRRAIAEKNQLEDLE